jgi:2-oxoglutarate dehydrogenase E2 component (dihydrolipoamide succinyltransferase)
VASPAAQRVLAERGLDVAQVPGSGPKGIVTKEDAVGFQPAAVAVPKTNGVAPPAVPTPDAKPQPVPAGRETRQPMTMIRRRIAERLLESQRQTATLTTFNECDLSAVMALREKYNPTFEKKHGTKLGFMSVFVKAAVEALKAFPMVNARIDGGDVVVQHFYDISVAVSTEKGLTVPVIRDADRLGFAAVEKAIADLAKKAKDGKLTPADMMGGTFTITNGGTFGSMMSTPILNPPQAAILGMHNIVKRPVVVNDAVVVRPMMYLALSYDHRLIDGREAVQFLVRVKECVESPERMLFEV